MINCQILFALLDRIDFIVMRLFCLLLIPLPKTVCTCMKAAHTALLSKKRIKIACRCRSHFQIGKKRSQWFQFCHDDTEARESYQAQMIIYWNFNSMVLVVIICSLLLMAKSTKQIYGLVHANMFRKTKRGFTQIGTMGKVLDWNEMSCI